MSYSDIELLEAAGLGDLPEALHATYAETMRAGLEEHVGGALLLILSVTQEAELILAADKSAAALASYLDANIHDYPEVVREETEAFFAARQLEAPSIVWCETTFGTA